MCVKQWVEHEWQIDTYYTALLRPTSQFDGVNATQGSKCLKAGMSSCVKSVFEHESKTFTWEALCPSVLLRIIYEFFMNSSQ